MSMNDNTFNAILCVIHKQLQWIVVYLSLSSFFLVISIVNSTCLIFLLHTASCSPILYRTLNLLSCIFICLSFCLHMVPFELCNRAKRLLFSVISNNNRDDCDRDKHEAVLLKDVYTTINTSTCSMLISCLCILFAIIAAIIATIIAFVDPYEFLTLHLSVNSFALFFELLTLCPQLVFLWCSRQSKKCVSSLFHTNEKDSQNSDGESDNEYYEEELVQITFRPVVEDDNDDLEHTTTMYASIRKGVDEII